MGKKEDEIQSKLEKLEAEIRVEEQASVAKQDQDDATTVAKAKSETLTVSQEQEVSSDMLLLGGVAAIGFGLFMVASNIRVGSNFLTLLMSGQHGMGFILLPLLIGIGMIFYDYNSRVAWTVTAVGVAIILISLLANMWISFASTSLIGLLVMVIPILAGVAMLARAARQYKALPKKQ